MAEVFDNSCAQDSTHLQHNHDTTTQHNPHHLPSTPRTRCQELYLRALAKPSEEFVPGMVSKKELLDELQRLCNNVAEAVPMLVKAGVVVPLRAGEKKVFLVIPQLLHEEPVESVGAWHGVAGVGVVWYRQASLPAPDASGACFAVVARILERYWPHLTSVFMWAKGATIVVSGTTIIRVSCLTLEMSGMLDLLVGLVGGVAPSAEAVRAASSVFVWTARLLETTSGGLAAIFCPRCFQSPAPQVRAGDAAPALLHEFTREQLRASPQVVCERCHMSMQSNVIAPDLFL
eukprot:TRINITY_DN2232_c0_g1_i4.p2 TRINITY_DN2232_c0_g1~~TRINITY_DN2232_c0_g1_i4.p2  ORF type:complete len:305 (-),score=87.95 TRINITY_DN2232_c0_g1_i4:150-1016(-)